MKKIAILLGFLFIPISIHTMEPFTIDARKQEIVTIRYIQNDTETKIEIPKRHLLLSATLKNQIDFGAHECYLSSDQISLKTLYDIKDLLFHTYKFSKPPVMINTIFNSKSPVTIKAIFKMKDHTQSKIEHKKTLKEKLEKKSNVDLVSLADGADYLAIDPLIQQITQVISQRILADKTSYKKMSNLNPLIVDQVIQQPVRFVNSDSDIYATHFSSDGTKIIWGSQDGTIKIADINKNNIIQDFRAHRYGVRTVDLSCDDTKIVSGGGVNDSIVKIWDTHTGNCLHNLADHTDNIKSVNFSSDGTKVISGSQDETVKIWNTNTGICLYTLMGHSERIFSAHFSPNSIYIASGSGDKTIKIWDTRTRNCLHTLKDHTCDVYSVNFSPDGTQIVSSSWDQTIKIWNALTGHCLHTLKGHTNGVNSVHFSPDGSHIISGSSDKTIKIWNALTGACLKTLTGHSSPVSSVHCSPDSIVSGSWDKTINLWPRSAESMLEYFQFSAFLKILNNHSNQFSN